MVSALVVAALALVVCIVLGLGLQTPATRINDGCSINYQAGSGGNNPGDVVVSGGLAGITTDLISANAVGSLFITGVFNVPKDASVFSQGDPVYWNATGNPQVGTAGTGCATSTAAGAIYLGMAAAAQVTGDNYVATKLNEVGTGGGSGRQPVINTNITTVGAGTLTAAAIVGGLITRSGSTAAFSDATGKASDIVAAYPGVTVNQSWPLRITNTTAFAQTITAGSGVTLSGLSNPIPANSFADFLVTVTAIGTPAVTMYQTGGSYDNGGGADPYTVLTQLGQSAAGAVLGQVREEGNLYAKAGNPIAGNAADTTDDILGGVQLPASVLANAAAQITITAQGQTGATTNNKRFKIFVNPTMTGQTVNADGSISGGHVTAGTPVCDSGAWVNGTTANSNVGWWALALITKYGALNSDTQMGQGQAIQGTLHGGVQSGQALTLDEDAAINVVVTGSSYTTGAASDVVLQQLTVTGSN